MALKNLLHYIGVSFDGYYNDHILNYNYDEAPCPQLHQTCFDKFFLILIFCKMSLQINSFRANDIYLPPCKICCGMCSAIWPATFGSFLSSPTCHFESRQGRNQINT